MKPCVSDVPPVLWAGGASLALKSPARPLPRAEVQGNSVIRNTSCSSVDSYLHVDVDSRPCELGTTLLEASKSRHRDTRAKRRGGRRAGVHGCTRELVSGSLVPGHRAARPALCPEGGQSSLPTTGPQRGRAWRGNRLALPAPTAGSAPRGAGTAEGQACSARWSCHPQHRAEPWPPLHHRCPHRGPFRAQVAALSPALYPALGRAGGQRLGVADLSRTVGRAGPLPVAS